MAGFIDQIISQLGVTGVAKPSRWIIRIQLPLATQNNQEFESIIDERVTIASSRIELACETVKIPGIVHKTGEARYHNLTFKRPINTEMEDIEATFRCSHDMFERKFFDAWMNTIYDPKTRNYGFANEYTVDIDIFQLSDTLDYPVYGVKLQNAYPIAVSALDANHDTTDDYHKQTVTFTYTQWRHINIRDDLYDTNKAVSSTVFNPINIVRNIVQF